MSITFFLKNHNGRVDLPNKDFNPSEKEDPIYNPRFNSTAIYPELNMSNINTSFVLEKLGVPFDYVGEFKNDQIDTIVRNLFIKIQALQHDVEYLEKQNKDTRETEYLLDKFKQLEIIGRYALALNDDIVWC